jgi:hypothetical protein
MLWQISTRRTGFEDCGETAGSLISVWSVGSNLVLCDLAEWDRSANTSSRCEPQPQQKHRRFLLQLGTNTATWNTWTERVKMYSGSGLQS